MRVLAIFALVLATIGSIIGCSNDKAESSLDFGYIGEQRNSPSLLRILNQKKGVLTIRIYDLTKVNGNQGAKWRTMVTRAINEWLAPLKSNKRINYKLTPNISFMKVPSRKNIAGCSVVGKFWDCKTSPDVLKIILDPDKAIERSHANVGQMKVVLSQDDAYPNADYIYKTLLHEIGHIFGLTDLYDSRFAKVRASKAIMGDMYKFKGGLQPDDKLGIVTLYDYLFKNGPFCPKGYTETNDTSGRICFKK